MGVALGIQDESHRDGRRAPGALGWLASDAVLTVGFSCFIATLLIYTAAVTPFQRLVGSEGFIPYVTMAAVAWATGASACALGVYLLSFALSDEAERVVTRLAAPLIRIAAAAYVPGCALYCAMGAGCALGGAFHSIAGAFLGVGALGQALLWGRALGRYGLREAMVFVSASVVGAALIWALLSVMPAILTIVTFFAASCATVGIALFYSRGPRDEQPPSPATARGTFDAIRSFLGVAIDPLVGLVLFAVITSVRAQLFTTDFGVYTIDQVLVGIAVLAIALSPLRDSMMLMTSRGLLPVLTVGAVAVLCVAKLNWGGPMWETAALYMPYCLSALLTLATLIAMAHAAEFSSDLIASVAVLLFCLATNLPRTEWLCPILSNDQIASACVITACYAIFLTVSSLVRSLCAERENGGAYDVAPAPRESAAPGSPDGPDAPTTAKPPAMGFEERCQVVATTYGLTNREREIFHLIAQGHSGAHIGEELVISAGTVRTHMHNIYRKLNVNSREDVIMLVQSIGRRD